MCILYSKRVNTLPRDANTFSSIDSFKSFLAKTDVVEFLVSVVLIFSVRCNIYISRLCYDVSVRMSIRLSVTEVHWHIIANLVFTFRSKFTAHCGCGEG